MTVRFDRLLRPFLAAIPGLALATAAFAGGPPIPQFCDCTWNNGSPDPVIDVSTRAIMSHEGGGAGPGIKSADDFYLDPSVLHTLTTISAEIVTSTIPQAVKARLELYADCDGKPGQLLHTFTKPRVAELGPGTGDLRRVSLTYIMSEQGTPASPAKPIALRGGSYWISVVGISDGLCPGMGMCDQTFWLAANSPIKGRPAAKNQRVPGDTPGTFIYLDDNWMSVEECCAGCIDLAFTVCTEQCKILYDGGVPDLTKWSTSLSGGPNIIESRTADDIVVPNCDPMAICYISGYVAMNCDPARARFDLYDSTCTKPSTFSPPLVMQTSNVTWTGQEVTIEGRRLKVYKVEVFNPTGPGGPIVLQAGQNYWLSVYGLMGGTPNERAYALGGIRCDDLSCSPTRYTFSPAHVSGMAAGINNFSWQPVVAQDGSAFDLALLVAIRPLTSQQIDAHAQNPCYIDRNHSGAADIDDLFIYLNEWFVGCP